VVDIRWNSHIPGYMAEWLDPKGKEVNIDHVGVFKLLAQANYQGFVSAEYEGEEQETRAVPRAIRYLRELS